MSMQQRGRSTRSRGGRGRAGYSGRSRDFANQSWRKLQTQETPALPLGSMLAEVHESDLADVSNVNEKSAKISDCKEIASFNWLNEKEPTILIPGWFRTRSLKIIADCHERSGNPPAWTPLLRPSKLKEDAGEYFRDQNAASYPSYPMQPAVEAILRQNPDFPTESIDIVGCGSTVGNLLRFVRKVDREFRMLVEVVGSTVFLIRRENSPREVIQNVYGYGHSFPEAYTTWASGVKGSESHQRLIKYTFGDLKCVVRFEADGYFPELVQQQSKDIRQNAKIDREIDSDQELASIFGDTILGRRDPDSTPRKESITIRSAGDHVPQAAIFDLKTRSIRKKDNNVLGEELPRLWVSQIPNFLLAFHKAGVFGLEEMQIHDAREKLAQWEENERDNLRQLALLLKLLVAFARARPDGRFELVHEEGRRVLELREVCDDVPKALPTTLSERWTKGGLDISDNDKLSSPAPEHQDKYTDLDWDSGSEKDYTACDSKCGYCGSCTH